MGALVAQDAYQAYLRRLDARALLDYYGAERCTEQVNNRDGTTEIVHSCLIDRVNPHHHNGDVNPSAACNIDKKKYVCYSLGWGGDLLQFIRVMEGYDNVRATLPIAAEFLTEAVVPARTLLFEMERLFDRGDYTAELPTYDESVLNAWTEGHPYWNERGITVGTMEALRLGYDPTTRRIVFPVFFGHQLVGWQKRAIPGESVSPEPKYKNSPGFPKSQVLYNYDLAKDYPRVCVVESAMSVAKALSVGVPNVVATFGSKVSNEQIRLLRDFEIVYIWFDRDSGGMGGEYKLTQGLYRHTTVKVVTPDGGKDMADASVEDIAVKLAHAVPAPLKLGATDFSRRLRR
jgi:DNA primase